MDQNKKILSSSVLFYAILFIFSFSLLLAPQAAHGQEAHDWNSWEIIPSECLSKDGDCNLNSFINLFVNLSYILLKVLPYITMLMMIIVGFNFISAGGNPEKIQSSKKMLISIFLGLIIILALAWSWSYFIVYALTCDPDKEESCTGKIFQGYPSVWEKEWWGGGEPIEYPINSGCCVVNEVGCEEMTESTCQDVINLFTFANPQFMGENQFCDQYISTCENYNVPGCCVSLAAGGSCGYPGSNGCLGYPNTQYTATPCQNLGSCLEILGEPPEESETGCCVTNNSCDMTSYQNCSGGFQVGTNCNNIDECNTGCCIGQTSCKNGKINCDGTWETTDCSNHTLDCATGCCETTNNCTRSTQGQCTGTYYSGSCSDPGDVPLPICQAGCCVTNCTSNKIDGNCPDGSYITDACGAFSATDCTEGCCLFSGTTNCSANTYLKDCQAAGDQWYGIGPCPSGDAQDCATGCCELSPSNCVEQTSRRWCTDSGGAFNVRMNCWAVAGCS